jgi:hypothetical protein
MSCTARRLVPSIRIEAGSRPCRQAAQQQDMLASRHLRLANARDGSRIRKHGHRIDAAGRASSAASGASGHGCHRGKQGARKTILDMTIILRAGLRRPPDTMPAIHARLRIFRGLASGPAPSCAALKPGSTRKVAQEVADFRHPPNRIEHLASSPCAQARSRARAGSASSVASSSHSAPHPRACAGSPRRSAPRPSAAGWRPSRSSENSG